MRGSPHRIGIYHDMIQSIQNDIIDFLDEDLGDTDPDVIDAYEKYKHLDNIKNSL